MHGPDGPGDGAAGLSPDAVRAIRMEASAATARALVHEIANYLGTIRTMASVLADEVPAGSDAGADLQTIVDAVEAGTRFLEGIRAFVHPASLGDGAADLNAVVREAEPRIRAAIPPGVRLRVQVAPGRLPVRGDPALVDRVVCDLVVAAAGLAPGGEVHVESGADGAAADLGVHVGGRSIDADRLRRIFEPFVADRGYESGLRLPTVYAVITASGGTITADRGQGDGASFRVRFPTGVSPTADEEGGR